MKKIVPLLVLFLCLTSCSVIKKKNDEKSKVSDITIYTVYPDQNDFDIFRLGYGTGEHYCTIKVPVYYVFSEGGFTDKNDEYYDFYNEDSTPNVKNAVELGYLDEDEDYCFLHFDSSVNGTVSIAFEIIHYNDDLNIKSFDDLKNLFAFDYKELDGAPYETIVLSGSDKTLEDFIMYINFNDEVCLSIEYDGDDSISNTDMALAMFDVIDFK